MTAPPHPPPSHRSPLNRGNREWQVKAVAILLLLLLLILLLPNLFYSFFIRYTPPFPLTFPFPGLFSIFDRAKK